MSKPMFEFDSVILKRSVTENDVTVPAGSKGVILIKYLDPSGYEVEFFDSSGESYGNFTLDNDDIEPA